MRAPNLVQSPDRPLWAALVIAVTQSRQSRTKIAKDVGVTLKTLQRWLKGETAPTTDEWHTLLKVCGASPIACMIIACNGHAEQISPPSQSYIDKLFGKLLEIIAEVDGAGNFALDPRAAARDASMLKQNWEAAFQRQQQFYENQYACLGERSLR